MDGPPAPPIRHAASYRVRFDEATTAGVARTSALLRYLQDVAWRHSEALGFGREWYAERGLFWLVRALELEVSAPAPTGEVLRASTAIVGFRKVLARRRSTIERSDGTLVATATVDWAMTDRAGRPCRVPDAFTVFFSGEPPAFEPLRVGRTSPPAEPTTRPIAVRPQETDPMGHANNATYLDWLEELVAQAGTSSVPDTYPRRYRLEYLAAAAPGRQLEESTWAVRSGWLYRLVDAADDTQELVRAALHVETPAGA